MPLGIHDREVELGKTMVLLGGLAVALRSSRIVLGLPLPGGKANPSPE